MQWSTIGTCTLLMVVLTGSPTKAQQCRVGWDGRMNCSPQGLPAFMPNSTIPYTALPTAQPEIISSFGTPPMFQNSFQGWHNGRVRLPVMNSIFTGSYPYHTSNRQTFYAWQNCSPDRTSELVSPAIQQQIPWGNRYQNVRILGGSRH